MTRIVDDSISAATAWRQSPGVRALEAAQTQLRAVRIPQPESDFDAVTAAAYDTLIAGGNPLDDLQPLADVERATAAHDRIHAALNEIGTRVRNGLDNARAAAADTALAWLQQRLTDDVLTPLPKIAEAVSGIDSGDEAIRAGKRTASAWAELTELAGKHKLIRNAQDTLVHHYAKHRSIGYGNVADIVRDHGIVQDGPFTAPSVTDGVFQAPRPAYRAVPTWPSGYGTDLLQWAARHPNTPLWVPSIPDLIQALETHRTREAERREMESPRPHRESFVKPSDFEREIKHQREQAAARAEYARQRGGSGPTLPPASEVFGP